MTRENCRKPKTRRKPWREENKQTKALLCRRDISSLRPGPLLSLPLRPVCVNSYKRDETCVNENSHSSSRDTGQRALVLKDPLRNQSGPPGKTILIEQIRRVFLFNWDWLYREHNRCPPYLMIFFVGNIQIYCLIQCHYLERKSPGSGVLLWDQASPQGKDNYVSNHLKCSVFIKTWLCALLCGKGTVWEEGTEHLDVPKETGSIEPVRVRARVSDAHLKYSYTRQDRAVK